MSARASSKYTIDTRIKSVAKAIVDVTIAKNTRGMDMTIKAGGARRYKGLKKKGNMMIDSETASCSRTEGMRIVL
jgi:hypothetical protein